MVNSHISRFCYNLETGTKLAGTVFEVSLSNFTTTWSRRKIDMRVFIAIVELDVDFLQASFFQVHFQKLGLKLTYPKEFKILVVPLV